MWPPLWPSWGMLRPFRWSTVPTAGLLCALARWKAFHSAQYQCARTPRGILHTSYPYEQPRQATNPQTAPHPGGWRSTAKVAKRRMHTDHADHLERR